MDQSISIAQQALANPPADLAHNPLLVDAQANLPDHLRPTQATPHSHTHAQAGAAAGLQSNAQGTGLDAKLQVGAFSLLSPPHPHPRLSDLAHPFTPCTGQSTRTSASRTLTLLPSPGTSASPETHRRASPPPHSTVLDEHMKGWQLADVGFNYDVVAVFGSQSTGKSAHLVPPMRRVLPLTAHRSPLPPCPPAVAQAPSSTAFLAQGLTS